MRVGNIWQKTTHMLPFNASSYCSNMPETPIEAMKGGQSLNLMPPFPLSPCLALDLFASISQIQFHWLKQSCLPALSLATTGLMQGMKWSLLKVTQPVYPILLLLFLQRGGEGSFRAG